MASLKEHQAVLLELLSEFDRLCKKHNISYVLFAGTSLGAVRHRGFIPWDDDLDVAMLRTEYERFMKVARDDLEKAYYLQEEFSDHWPLHFSKLRKNNTTCLEKYHPKDPQTHQGIYIDIFPIDNASDNAFMRKLQFFSTKIVFAKAFFKRGYETDSAAKKVFITLCRLLPLKPFHRLAMKRNATHTRCVHSFFGGSTSFHKGIYPREWFTQTVMGEFEGQAFPISARYDELLTTLYGDYMTLPKEEDRKVKEHALLVDTEKNYTEYEHYRDGMTFEVYTRSIR